MGTHVIIIMSALTSLVSDNSLSRMRTVTHTYKFAYIHINTCAHTQTQEMQKSQIKPAAGEEHPLTLIYDEVIHWDRFYSYLENTLSSKQSCIIISLIINSNSVLLICHHELNVLCFIFLSDFTALPYVRMMMMTTTIKNIISQFYLKSFSIFSMCNSDGKQV